MIPLSKILDAMDGVSELDEALWGMIDVDPQDTYTEGFIDALVWLVGAKNAPRKGHQVQAIIHDVKTWLSHPKEDAVIV